MNLFFKTVMEVKKNLSLNEVIFGDQAIPSSNGV